MHTLIPLGLTGINGVHTVMRVVLVQRVLSLWNVILTTFSLHDVRGNCILVQYVPYLLRGTLSNPSLVVRVHEFQNHGEVFLHSTIEEVSDVDMC